MIVMMEHGKAEKAVVGARECSGTCTRYEKRRLIAPRTYERAIGWWEAIEWRLGELSAQVLKRPVLTVILVASIVLLSPSIDSAPKETYQATAALGNTPLAVSIAKLGSPVASGFWKIALARIASRWTILVALGGLLSVLRVLKGAADSQQHYLKMDLQIQAPKPTDTHVIMTTTVENTLEDDRKIHNALVLIGSATRTAQELLQSLNDDHAAVGHRIWCGQQIDTWQIREIPRGEGTLLSNLGSTWSKDSYPDPEMADMEPLLAACPLDPRPLSTGSGANFCLIQSLPFYFEENDDIANERVSFPIAVESSLFEPGHAYIARFYIIGEQPYPVPVTMSRCTAQGFVIPKTA
jgi:hypothetical protein